MLPICIGSAGNPLEIVLIEPISPLSVRYVGLGMRLLTRLIVNALGTVCSRWLFSGMRLAYTAEAHPTVTNRRRVNSSHSDSAFERKQQGAGRLSIGTCGARVKIGKQLSIACALLCTTASTQLWATTDSPSPAKTSFAYSVSHTVKPLPASVIEKIAEPYADSLDSDDGADLTEPRAKPVEVVVSPTRQPSRDLVCSAVASVALANNLPIPFFANLIWQESSFDSKTISRAGAQGIAQFMPQTAVEVGLINPFEPIHALNAAGKFVSDLRKQFGNLGLAAAAYNAGPRRITDWLGKRGELPGETRNYVIRVTGRPAEEWIAPKNDPEMLLMPAKAPCVEVVEAVQAQTKTVRLARLISELATTASQMRDKPEPPVPSALEADTTERGWRARVAVMVRNVLKRLEEKQAATKIAAKSAYGAAVKTARHIEKVDEHAPGKTARRYYEIKTFIPSGGKNAPKSTDKEIGRSAIKTANRDESIETANPETNGLAKIDLSKSEAVKPDMAKLQLVRLDEAKADEAKANETKANETKANDAKSDSKEAAKPAAPRRSMRVVRFTYTDNLRPF